VWGRPSLGLQVLHFVLSPLKSGYTGRGYPSEAYPPGLNLLTAVMSTISWVTARICEECDGPNLRPRSRWCSQHCKDVGRGVDCTGCGEKIMRGPGVVAGLSRCNPCRRDDRLARTPGPLIVVCPCGFQFEAAHPGRKYCDQHRRPRSTVSTRPDLRGWAYRKLREQVLREETHCWLCGEEVDKSLRYPDRMCASADHVMPVAAGGAPHDRENIRLAHLFCNMSRPRPTLSPL
jgi:hypothetical protein